MCTCCRDRKDGVRPLRRLHLLRPLPGREVVGIRPRKQRQVLGLTHGGRGSFQAPQSHNLVPKGKLTHQQDLKDFLGTAPPWAPLSPSPGRD